MIKKIKQNKEVILIFIIALLFGFYLIGNQDFMDKYISNGLNNILLPIFGVFFGSLITAYTITIAFSNQIPSKVKETKAYKRINLYFLLTLSTLLILILTSLIFYFTNAKMIFFINLFLTIFSFLMFFYLIIVIYQLVRIINKN